MCVLVQKCEFFEGHNLMSIIHVNIDTVWINDNKLRNGEKFVFSTHLVSTHEMMWIYQVEIERFSTFKKAFFASTELETSTSTRRSLSEVVALEKLLVWLLSPPSSLSLICHKETRTLCASLFSGITKDYEDDSRK